MVLTVFADTRWALFVEMGTSRMPARPFLRPAITEVGKVFGTSVQAQFATVAAKYQPKAKRYVKRLAGPKTVIGHRTPVANRKGHGRHRR